MKFDEWWDSLCYTDAVEKHIARMAWDAALRTRRPEAERNQIIEECANAARNAMIMANGKPGTWVLDAIRDLKVSPPQPRSG